MHRDNLLKYWQAAKAGIKRDTDKADLIDVKLEQAIASFDCGDREPGRSLMVEISNVLNLNTLRWIGGSRGAGTPSAPTTRSSSGRTHWVAPM